MSDLIERLRDLKERVYPDDLMEEAAAEIERLKRVVGNQQHTMDAQRKEIERLRGLPGMDIDERCALEGCKLQAIERLKAVLHAVDCPECGDNSGAYARECIGYDGEPDLEMVQCRFCADRESLR